MKKFNYGHRTWRKAREKYLRVNGICARCGRPADVVDHIVKHNNDPVLIWDTDNWQALCKLCHDGHKQRLEKTGVIIGCDDNGIPVDPDHWWNKK